MFWYKIYKKPGNLKLNKKIIGDILLFIWENISKKQGGILNLIFENDENIRILNRDYRQIDKTTDVLSFHYYDNFDNLKKTEIAWEIIFSISKIQLQAEEYNHSKEEEFYKLLIHSILHIIGFDHESENEFKIMKAEEDKIIEKIEKIYNIRIS